MKDELLQFKKLHVWRLVKMPPNKRPIGTKWVFRNKKDDKRVITRYKTRLVVQGFSQHEGVDYDETYAPVARLEAIRLFLAYASYMNFKAPRAWYATLVEHLLKNSYRRGVIDQTLFIKKVKGD
ncbi:putative mitochondrial protein AtMg00820 [Bidens hawaiensis]|uniref:putative mitochondrial protein AtMg00820 n=1 Tax=Bidens hawaiensis TaxID=980011 RepID=UPI00404B61D2